MSVRFVITGKPRRAEIGVYPLEAIRECVTNDILTYYNPFLWVLAGLTAKGGRWLIKNLILATSYPRWEADFNNIYLHHIAKSVVIKQKRGD
jgi:hypothetical protein